MCSSDLELSSKMQVLEENFMKNEEDIDVSSMFQKVLSDEKDQETSCKNITSKENCKPPCSYIWLDDLRACVTKTAESEKLSNAIRFKILQRKKEQQGGSNIDDDNDLLVQKVSSLQDEIILNYPIFCAFFQHFLLSHLDKNKLKEFSSTLYI